MPSEAQRLLDEAKATLAEVEPQARTIRDGLREYKGLLRKHRHLTYWLVGIIVGGVLAVGLLGWSTYKTSQCNSRWANDYTARTTTLTDLSTPRSDANAKLLRDVFTPGITKEQIIADGAAFARADTAYKKALKDHPIPPSPTNHCSVF